MANAMAVQVTIYLNEADQWHHRPLHMEILQYLRQENAYAATAIHAVAGFLGRQRVETAHLAETGGKLPVIMYVIHDGGHVVPNPNYRYPEILGRQTRDLDAPAVIWEFFSRLPLRR